MHRVDTLHVTHPFAGFRMLRSLLQRQGHCVGRRHVAYADEANEHAGAVLQVWHQYLSPPAQGLPHLLRNKPVTHSNQVVAMDITYVRMHKGWVYLCAVVDLYSRKVQAVKHHGCAVCVDAVQEAIAHWGTPAIFNTDQGRQFTRDTFTGLLKCHGICISMHGKGAWRDNVFDGASMALHQIRGDLSQRL